MNALMPRMETNIHQSYLFIFAKLLCFIIVGYEIASVQTYLHCSVCLFIKFNCCTVLSVC
jgi:hypothetical protein